MKHFNEIENITERRAEIAGVRSSFEAVVRIFSETREGTPAATAAAVIAELGREGAVRALAEMVRGVSPFDVRIGSELHAWADAQDAHTEAELRAHGIYTPDSIHRVHLAQLANAVRKATC